MTPFRFWKVKEEYSWWNINLSLAGDGLLVMVNGKEIYDRKCAFNALWPQRGLNPGPWPADAPIPHIYIEEPDYHPDYFICENWIIVSSRMAEAMALRPDDADLIPVTVTGNCAKAQAMGYHWLRPRTFSDFLDYENSNCRWEWGTSAKTGERYRSISYLGRIRFLPHAVAPADFFKDQAGPDLYATDALALRVLEAGCTGMIFDHPLWTSEPGRIKVVRGLRGPERHLYNEDFSSFVSTDMSWEEADAGSPATAPKGIADFVPKEWKS